jgi:hypothetical protein
MADIEKLGIQEDQIKSVDDVPEAARLAERQRFLNRWYRPVATAPFAVLLIVVDRFFPNAQGWLWARLAIATMLWAVGVAGYAFYLMLAFKCPKCHKHFGLGEACKSCDLPRHGAELESLDISTLRPLNRDDNN